MENPEEKWSQLLAEAPARPSSGKPTPEQLKELRDHKQRVRQFLSSLPSDDQRAKFRRNRKQSSQKAAKAERVRRYAEKLAEKKEKDEEASIEPSWPQMTPLNRSLRLGWNDGDDDDGGRIFRGVLPFCSHTVRSRFEEREDETVWGGIDRRVFSNLFVDAKPLRVPLPLEEGGDGDDDLFRPCLSEAAGPSAENFYQASKCAFECDARFIVEELSPMDAARFGRGHLALTGEQKEKLVALGAPPDQFRLVEEEKDFETERSRWKRGTDGSVARRSNWDEKKHLVMLHVLRAKFGRPEPGTAAAKAVSVLADASSPFFPAIVVEHRARDAVWGDAGNGRGSNLLGKAITQVLLEVAGRSALRDPKPPIGPLLKPNSDIVRYSWPKPTQNSKLSSNSDARKVDCLCILDFEATCNRRGPAPKPQEIIEFPTLLLNTETCEVESEFHHYIKPDVHPVLSAFCTELTGIAQEKVDSGVPLFEALDLHQNWLDRHGLVPSHCVSETNPNERTFLYATCGDWDLGTCLPRQTSHHNREVSAGFQSWVNVKVAFERLYNTKAAGMTQMLHRLGMELRGRHHSGIDDCRNIARICARMLSDGWIPENTQI